MYIVIDIKVLKVIIDSLKKKTNGRFECDVTWFYFDFDFVVHMHGAVVVPLFVYVFKLCK